MNTHKNCLICNSDKLKDHYKNCGLVKCSDCGFVFMKQIPSEQELNDCYKTYSYVSTKEISPITIKVYNALLDEFEKHRKTNKILDVGCGKGTFLIEAKKRNWEVYGTEYSEVAVKICQNNNIHIRKGQLKQNSFNSEEFDIITSFEVIEHINNPIEEINLIHKFLRKNGLFYCTTPNFNSIYRYYLKSSYNVICYPEHLSYYTKKTLNKLLKSNGFRKIKFLSTGISLDIIKNSKKANVITNQPPINKDEKLRQNIDSNRFLKNVKRLTNFFLSKFNLGIALKGYYEKI